ncbi:MAG: RHS repeat-associated core domain-containing protein [Verrucomicrobiota bacterium]
MAILPDFPLLSRTSNTSEVTKSFYEVSSKSSQTVATVTFYFNPEDFNKGPFGELIRSSGTAPCNFGFSTKYRDSETGLHYYGYRYYSSGLGRWLGRDPIEEQGGLNLYGMVGNDEVNQADYLGQETVSVVYWTLIEDAYVSFYEPAFSIPPWKLRKFNGGVKTVHGFTFDTVTREMQENPVFTGTTQKYDDKGKLIASGHASGSSLKVRQTKNESCEVEYTMTGNERNPLASILGIPAPGITYEAKFDFDYNKMKLTVSGSHDGFPSHAIKVNGSTVYKFSHRVAGTSPLRLIPTGFGQTISASPISFTAK